MIPAKRWPARTSCRLFAYSLRVIELAGGAARLVADRKAPQPTGEVNASPMAYVETIARPQAEPLPPVVRKLRAVFENIEAELLLVEWASLKSTHERGLDVGSCP